MLWGRHASPRAEPLMGAFFMAGRDGALRARFWNTFISGWGGKREVSPGIAGILGDTEVDFGGNLVEELEVVNVER